MASLLIVFLGFVGMKSVHGDIYMHTPRGNNNRNCRNDNNENRRNANRLFDSENNDKGGYSCPRAYPFPCYKFPAGEERDACNAQNTENPSGQMINKDTQQLLNGQATETERLFYYAGSEMYIAWTNQHGSGKNEKLHSDIVIQVACENTLEDDCGVDGNPEKCGPRDGIPVNNNDNNNLNDEATDTITLEVDAQDDYRYGRNEGLRYYQKCRNRERNKGLWIADQNLNTNDARSTRQNPNGNNRYGLECHEERDYFPYWHDSPWVDIAYLTDDVSQCEFIKANSQNNAAKYECVCSETSPQCSGDGQLPNNERACNEKEGANWVRIPSHNEAIFANGMPEIDCREASFSRVNHLGNVADTKGHTYSYNWTIPEVLAGQKNCFIRIRYNVTTGDYNRITKHGNSTLNGEKNPLKDRDESEEESYKLITGLVDSDGRDELGAKLGYAVNTDQHGRTFQDRSYSFPIKKRPDDIECDKIHNLNVRGKRGNIVQVYPATEYDFAPNELIVSVDDCIHIQWVGSDYNPNRNPNNGEGGPPNPNNVNQAKADRSNLVQMVSPEMHYPILNANDFDIFDISLEDYKRLAFLDQPIDDPSQCYDVDQLKQIEPNNREARERSHKNCMKLSAAMTPYFNAGLVKPKKEGTFYFMSTRNNNFSNRSQKATLKVTKGSGLATGAAVAVGLSVTVVLLGLAGLLWVNRSRFTGKNPALQMPTFDKKPGAVNRPPVAPLARPNLSKKKAKAAYPYTAAEDGELSFAKGETITVFEEDASGWWRGQNSKKEVGVFPSNYLEPAKDVTGVNRV